MARSRRHTCRLGQVRAHDRGVRRRAPRACTADQPRGRSGAAAWSAVGGDDVRSASDGGACGPATIRRSSRRSSRRAELVEQLGVDVFCVMPFTQEFMKLPPEQLCPRPARRAFARGEVIVGVNFTFGRKAAGTIETMEEMGDRFGFEVDGVKLLAGARGHVLVDLHPGLRRRRRRGAPRRRRWDGRTGWRVSSCTATAEAVSWGFPTANVAPPMYSAIPADGVYAAWFTVLGPGPTIGTVTSGKPARRRCRSAPTRRSPGAPAPSRRTCSTARRTCTASTSRSISSSACAACKSSIPSRPGRGDGSRRRASARGAGRAPAEVLAGAATRETDRMAADTLASAATRA